MRGAVAGAVLATLVVLSTVAAGVATGAPPDQVASGLRLAETQPAQDGDTAVAVKSKLGRIAQSDADLVARTDSSPVNVVVKLDYDSIASYGGSIAGLAATSPEVTGKELRANRGAVEAYDRWIAQFESAVKERIRDLVSGVTIRDAYRAVYGGLALTVPASEAKELLEVEGVVAVQEDELLQPLTDVTPAFVGATDVWPTLGGATKAGEGVVVGVLDTGIWPEHPSLADHGLAVPPGGPYGCEFGDGSDVAHLGPAFTCTNKLVGAYAFVDTYMAVIGAEDGEYCNNTTGECSARDADGHGTHTATTAAGGPVANAALLGVDRGAVSGIAPGAHMIAYRVCLDLGCFQSDSVAAVQQAILDGVDVLNFSISGGSDAYSDPVELAFLEAFGAGVLVNASAGNSGPGPATANHAGPWTNTVGASTSDRHFIGMLELTATGGDSLQLYGATVTGGISTPTDVVHADSIPGYNPLCDGPPPPGSVTDLVVVCERGAIARAQKGFNVMLGGGAGMILYNPSLAMSGLNTDSHWVPSIHLEHTDAPALNDFVSTHTGVQATFTTGVATSVPGDVMAAFSSRGPLGDFVKPDVTAPGVQILAGMTPAPWPGNIVVGPPGELFQAIAGTSMSSPHAAGVAALVKDAHPDWTPGQIKSALMTSAVQGVLKEDGATASTPFDRGAGSIRADRAASPTVTFDVSYDDYVAGAGSPLGRIHLNLPSVNAPTMPGEITTWRTLKNVSGDLQVLEISTSAPAGAEILVAKSRPGWWSKLGFLQRLLVVPNGREETIQITIRAPGLPEGQYFGQITLTPRFGGSPVVLPVAFYKKQGDVTLKHVCSPTTFPRSDRTTCEVVAENFSFSPAQASIEVRADRGLQYANASAPATLVSKRKIAWSGELGPVEPPDVTIAADPGGSPAGGYLPLSGFGVAPVGGVGDETITNFTVPGFPFGGETWTRLGIVSNGYVVAGGGTAADVNFVNQAFPNGAPPNNVLAPFWTDLNPGAGGAIRIATLTDGVDTWIVVDFEAVPEFSNAANTHDFQIWKRIGTTEDITYTFGPQAGNGDGGFLTVGAENKFGNRGQNYYVDGAGTLPAAGDELRVSSAPPAAGGTVAFTYEAWARRTGAYATTAELLSDVTPGTTQVVQELTVTP